AEAAVGRRGGGGAPRHYHRMERQRPVAEVSYDRRATRPPRRVLRRPRIAQINLSAKHSTQPNRRGTDPYARWCGRREVVRLPPIPIQKRRRKQFFQWIFHLREVSRTNQICRLERS